MVAINRKLNLVVPISRGDETVLYIHSMPIRQETFEQNHLVLAKTFSTLFHNNLDPSSGPSVAALVLKDIARATARAPGLSWYDGPDGVGGESGLLADMTRLSNAVVPTKDGWKTRTLQEALAANLIDEEEKAEALNLITFFIVVSAVAPRTDREALVTGEARLYGLQTTYSNCTEFAASLTTSTPEETSGEKSPA